MRGILGMISCIVHCMGITPAHAGNTVIGQFFVNFEQDHPRACGEYRSAVRKQNSLPGSPPRMRGILGNPALFTVPAGITPAHAGNTESIP